MPEYNARYRKASLLQKNVCVFVCICVRQADAYMAQRIVHATCLSCIAPLYLHCEHIQSALEVQWYATMLYVWLQNVSGNVTHHARALFSDTKDTKILPQASRLTKAMRGSREKGGAWTIRGGNQYIHREQVISHIWEVVGVE